MCDKLCKGHASFTAYPAGYIHGHNAKITGLIENDAFVNKFKLGDYVRKKSGSQWQGKVVGVYSTNLTPEGYCVESDVYAGSVQIYPVAALELVPEQSL